MFSSQLTAPEFSRTWRKRKCRLEESASLTPKTYMKPSAIPCPKPLLTAWPALCLRPSPATCFEHTNPTQRRNRHGKSPHQNHCRKWLLRHEITARPAID